MAASRRYESRGQFSAPPDALWPLLADTQRLNQAAGMPPIEYTVVPGAAVPLTSAGAKLPSRIEAAVKVGRAMELPSPVASLIPRSRAQGSGDVWGS